MFDETSDPTRPDPTLAAEVCCKLISAYLANQESVDWSDVQIALDTALKAFDLPQSNIEDMAGQTDNHRPIPTVTTSPP
ncbi:hypothetical protein RMS29_026680 (plasmid) [Agrobacterium rosae]|uniref:Uncharacterized protein n=1 Tax=Agrobacterium rosae TaxID=1972867 RepID=A0ABU4W520_9HYPH|nr:hypothetical protein [Agrobacterium rosae]MDX8331860.1 hypothetical protein [Agrobacterium rosae]